MRKYKLILFFISVVAPIPSKIDPIFKGGYFPFKEESIYRIQGYKSPSLSTAKCVKQLFSQTPPHQF